MNIDEKVFKKSIILFNKLIQFGFKKENDLYIYREKIMNDTLLVEVTVNKGIVSSKIIDLSFNEEYINHKNKNQFGEYVNMVRSELEKILFNIRDNCTIQKYFFTEQANRITNLIISKYKNKPEFLWEDSNAIFRNPKSKKWYALIMSINKNKIDKEDIEVEVINLKLDPDKIKSLLYRKGFYKAYHMNKKYWITITLDNTVDDEEIMKYIEESHKFTEK